MFKHFVFGFFELLKRPSLVLPAFFGVLFGLALNLFVSIYAFDFLYNTIVLGEVVESSLLALPFYLIFSNPTQVFVLALGFLASIVNWVFFTYVYAECFDKSILESIKIAFSRLKEIFGLSVFIFFALTFYFVILFGFFVLAVQPSFFGIIGFLLSIAWALIGFYAGVKLIFAPAIMGVKRRKLKRAFSESWFSKTGFFNTLLFIFVLTAIHFFLKFLFFRVGELVGNEVFLFVLTLLGATIANAYYLIVFIKYVVDDVVA